MARTNWIEVEDQFFNQLRTDGLTLIQFCEKHGLTYRTAQKHISPQKGRKNPSSGNSGSRGNSGNSGNSNSGNSGNSKQKTKRATAQKAKGGKPNKATPTAGNKTAKTSKVDAPRGGACETKKSQSQGISKTRKNHILENACELSPRKENRGTTFSKYNCLGLKHGGYMSMDGMDKDIAEQAALITAEYNHNQSPEVVLARARVLQMNRITGELLHEETLKPDLFAKIQKAKDVNPEDVADLALHGSLLKRQSNIVFGTNEQFIRCTQTILAADEGHRRNELTLRRQNAFSGIEILDLTEKIYRVSKEQELTAIESVDMFESIGLKAPQLLLKQAEQELAWRTPPEGSDGSLTEQEIEDLRNAYIEEQQTVTKQLEERNITFTEKLALINSEEMGDQVDFNAEYEDEFEDEIITKSFDGEDLDVEA